MQFLKDLIEEKEIKKFWQEYRDFCTNIQTIDIDQFLDALPNLIKKLEVQYTTRQLDDAVFNLVKNNLPIGEGLYKKILKIDNPIIFPQLANIIGGLYYSNITSAITKTKGLILSYNENLKKIGIVTIARFDLSNDKCPKEFLGWLDTYLYDLANDENEQNLWPSIFFISTICKNHIVTSNKIIETLSIHPTIEIQQEILNYLSYNLDLENEIDIVEKYLPKLLLIDLKYKGTYSQLSYFLETLLKTHSRVAIEFLNKWVGSCTENARNIGNFKYFLNTFYYEHYQEFQELYTHWLNKDLPNFHIAIFEMSRAGALNDVSQLTLSKEILKDYSIYDIEYITYKVLAYVYDKDSSLSLIYSIFEQKFNDKEITRFLREIFIEHFIFNYFSTIDFLNEKKKTANPKLKKIIKSIVEEGLKSYSTYTDLEVLKEFAPSERRLNVYYKSQNKKFNKSYKDTDDDSFSFMSMTKNIQYRTGKSIFSKHNGVYTQEIIPTLISHSAEMPRGEFIDPIGQAKMRLMWQNFRRQK